MGKLLQRLSDGTRSGVYCASHAGDILDAVAGSDLQVARIDLAGVVEKEALFERISVALRFPGWFGRNWDALLDCLRDLSWSNSRRHVLIFENAKSLGAEDRSELIEVLAEAASNWRGTEDSFFAVFIGAAPDLPPLYRERQ
jgi:RNAse (barnase) inhibitor barstar